MIIRQLLIDTDYLALLSLDQVAVELEAGWLVALRRAPPEMMRTIGVSTRQSWQPTRLQAEFLADLQAASN
jgi:hypothetical protein